VDAVLLLGPLYHLVSRAERTAAIREAARILRPGGPLFAAAISRWATRIDGIIGKRIYLEYPAALDLIDDVERTGNLPPLHASAFTAYTHRRDDLRAELTEAGFQGADLVSVEGPGLILPDLEARMTDPADPCRHPRRGQEPGTRPRTERLRPPPARHRDPPRDRLSRRPWSSSSTSKRPS
jgi:SAM-dependent methyltransferase